MPPAPSAVPPEADSLQSVLERNRRTFAWKTSGLDEVGLRATTAASTMTLGGLVKHVALVEADWLAVKLAGLEYGPLGRRGFRRRPRLGVAYRRARRAGPGLRVWRRAVERSREVVAEVIEERGLDGQASFTWSNGRTPTVRAMLLDMIEEYARHTGHADILREAVDGRVGEGAPADSTSEGPRCRTTS